MRVHPIALSLPILAAAVLLRPSTAAAQNGILLRYQPHERLVIHTTSSTTGDVRFALGGLVEMFAAIGQGMAEAFGDTSGISVRDSLEAAVKQAGTDSMRIEMDLQQYFTEQVLARSGDETTVFRTVDSTTLRTRADKGWQTTDPDELPTTSAQAIIDSRLRISDFRLVNARPSQQDMGTVLRAPYGMIEVHLPEQAVAPGQSWSSDIAFPLSTLSRMEAENSDPGLAPGDIISHARFTLDSLVDRGLDTLAYIRLRGVFEPTEESEDSAGVSGTITTQGSIAGTLVWSTGWSAFVTGGWRTELTLDVSMTMMGAKDPVTMGAQIDLMNRFVVEP